MQYVAAAYNIHIYIYHTNTDIQFLIICCSYMFKNETSVIYKKSVTFKLGDSKKFTEFVSFCTGHIWTIYGSAITK